jgi:hypothetical protein
VVDPHHRRDTRASLRAARSRLRDRNATAAWHRPCGVSPSRHRSADPARAHRTGRSVPCLRSVPSFRAFRHNPRRDDDGVVRRSPDHRDTCGGNTATRRSNPASTSDQELGSGEAFRRRAGTGASAATPPIPAQSHHRPAKAGVGGGSARAGGASRPCRVEGPQGDGGPPGGPPGGVSPSPEGDTRAARNPNAKPPEGGPTRSCSRRCNADPLPGVLLIIAASDGAGWCAPCIVIPRRPPSSSTVSRARSAAGPGRRGPVRPSASRARP